MILKLTLFNKEEYIYVNDKNIIYYGPREYNNKKYTYIKCTDDVSLDVNDLPEQIRWWINSQSQVNQYSTGLYGTSGTCGTGGDAIEHGKYINNSGLSKDIGEIKPSPNSTSGSNYCYTKDLSEGTSDISEWQGTSGEEYQRHLEYIKYHKQLPNTDM